jgi:hypothetical protein
LYRGFKSNPPPAFKGKKDSRESSATYSAKVASTSKGEDAPVQPKARSRTSMEDRWQKPYSFKREAVNKIFDWVLKEGKVILPEPRRPQEVNETDKQNYCKYHRLLGHTIEDCWVFKNLIEKMIQDGEIEVRKSAKQEPPRPHERPAQSSNFVTINMISTHAILNEASSSDEDICSVPVKM